MTAPPGWYPDPITPQTVRWWDGVRWSPHWAPAAHGSDPRRDLAAESRAGERARIALLVAPALWLGDYLVVASVFGDIVRRFRHLFDTLQNGDQPDSFSVLPWQANVLLDLAGLLLLAAQVLFIIWLYQAAEVGRRAGIPARHSPGWAIAGFVVPVVNFWFPYESAADLFPVGHPDRRLAGRWWTWYLIQSGLFVPLLITAYFSTAVSVTLAVVFGVAPLLAAQSARRLIAAANAAHAQVVSRA